jgi:hypothetical protein
MTVLLYQSVDSLAPVMDFPETIERSKVVFRLILFVLRLGFQPDRHALNG